MTKDDTHEFLDFLRKVMKSYDMPSPSQQQIELWWGALENHSLEDLHWAFMEHARDPEAGQFKPMPAHLIRHLRNRIRNQWPSDAQAWQQAKEAVDQDVTIVWTWETAQAASEVEHMLYEGNETGAWIAFREIYNRYVEQAVLEGRTPQDSMRVSVGYDSQQRTAAIEQAAADGLLPEPQMAHLLQHHGRDEGGMAEELVAGLLEGPQEQEPDTVKEHFRHIRDILKADKEPEPDYEERERRRQAAAAMIGNKTRH